MPIALRRFLLGEEHPGFLYRFAVGLGLTVVLIGTYQIIGAEVRPSGMSLSTPLDDAVPFLPWTVWFYLPGYVLMFLTAVIAIEDRTAFWRTVVALVLSAAPTWVCHLAMPIAYPRPTIPPGPGLDLAMMRWVYQIDPAVNTFPSLHVALAATTILATWRVRRDAGAVTAILGGLMTVSVLTTKQHFIADIVAAWAIALLASRVAMPPPPCSAVFERFRRALGFP